MLRAELKDSDIPHRSKMRSRIMEVWDDHLNTLQREMAVCTFSSHASHLRNIFIGCNRHDLDDYGYVERQTEEAVHGRYRSLAPGHAN